MDAYPIQKMNLTINNRQRRHRVDRKRITCLTNWLMMRTPNLSPDLAREAVSLILTDDDGIRCINREVFGRDEVTDVITCCYDPLPGPDEQAEAELIINLQRAVAAARGGWSASRELALYIAHGCDHLAGADDATPAEAMRMRRRELRWLREAAAQDLVEGLLG